MAKITCRKGFVEVPRMTLNALKGLLFTNENGVDLSTIINDLKMGKDDELTAINVGLVYNGLTPKIDESTRYAREYDTIRRYEFVGVSLIQGIVKVKSAYKRYDHYDKYELESEWHEEEDIAAYGFDQWEEWSTDIVAVTNELYAKYPKPQTAE
jgi:hypothetical protein